MINLSALLEIAERELEKLKKEKKKYG